jgi:hypothetical protein
MALPVHHPDRLREVLGPRTPAAGCRLGADVSEDRAVHQNQPFAGTRARSRIGATYNLLNLVEDAYSRFLGQASSHLSGAGRQRG